jgi:hypothetical protein
MVIALRREQALRRRVGCTSSFLRDRGMKPGLPGSDVA